MKLAKLPTDIDIESVDAPSLEADAGFWRLYQESFPSSERDPRAVVLATTDPRVGFSLRARSHDQTIGLVVAHRLHEPAVVFLVYLAVDTQSRSHGVGSALLTGAEAFGSGEFNAEGQTMHGMVWEIDDPAEAVDDDERMVRLRRRRFFERAGGRPLDIPYLQPPIDGHSLVPMQLMYKPSSGTRVPGSTEAPAMVRAIYGQKYGAMNGIAGPVLEELLRRARTPGARR